APIDEVQLRVIRPGDPCGRAAGLPAIAAPRFIARLARCGNRIEAPRALARLRIVGVDETANAELAARDADNDFIFYDQWCEREAVTFTRVFGCGVPDDCAGACVERDHMRVEGCEIKQAAEYGKSAVDSPAAGANAAFGQLAFIAPEHAPRARVERVGAIVLP